MSKLKEFGDEVIDDMFESEVTSIITATERLREVRVCNPQEYLNFMTRFLLRHRGDEEKTRLIRHLFYNKKGQLVM